MPHLVIEHSADISKKSVKNLEQEIQNLMQAHEGNFDADQCKCRSFALGKYLVGRIDQSSASFIHITLKALSGRSIEIRKSLSDKIATFTKQFFLDLKLPTRRCDISVDIVEMERDTYTKIRIET